METNKNIFESFEDVVSSVLKKQESSDSLIFGNKNKSKRKKKIVIEEPVNQYQEQLNKSAYLEEPEIIVPKSIADTVKDQQIAVAEQKTQNEYQEFNKQQIIQQAIQVAKTEGTQNVDDSLETAVAETLEEISGNDMTDVNVVEVVATTVQAFEELPDAQLTLDSVEIITSKTKKDKSGYFKTKVNIRKSNIPDVINKIASIVKKESNGIISPRVCDLRVIGNTNKTQLRNKTLKLSAATVVFKPDHKRFKVNKGTRIMLSHHTNGNLLVYIQESRAKTILEVSQKEFDSESKYVAFLANCIYEYYQAGYDVTLKKLQLRGTNNPLLPVIRIIVGTGDYKVKPVTAADGNIYRFDVHSKSDQNQWLRVVFENVMTGAYKVYGINEVTGDEYPITTNLISLKVLEENAVYILNKSYSRNWDKELSGENALPEMYYMLNKLNHRKLRLVAIELFMSEKNENKVFDYPVVEGIEILKTASKRDMIKLQKTDYDAEMIIGKTPYLDYFYLTYLAYPIIGGDKRKGREYINRDEYYQKYNVLNRSQYQKRRNTIIEKQGIERNYNSRIYLFQLEYSVNGVTNIYRAKTLKELLDATKFLSNNPEQTVASPI